MHLAARKVNDSFSEEEILYWRNLYVNASAPDLFMQYSKEHSDVDYKDLYEMSDKRVAISSFQNMLCGKSYKNLPYYSKKQQK